MKIKCPNCGKETEFFIHEAIDEDGEVFLCKHCKKSFRYAER